MSKSEVGKKRREENKKMPLPAGFLLLASDFVRQPEKINCALLVAVQVAKSAHQFLFFK